MRPVILIAANFLREARWYVVIMVAWVIGLAFLIRLDTRPKPEDLLFVVRQEAAYGIALALMMGATAINNDRKTRRILSILSKAVERRQYLAGLILGITYQTLIFLATVGICGSWMAQRLRIPDGPLWTFLLLPFCASVLAAAAGLLCGAFLHPLFATAGAALLLGAQLGMEHGFGHGSGLLPVTAIVRSFFRFDFQPDLSVALGACVVALLEAVILWVVAGLIFERRDIAVATD